MQVIVARKAWGHGHEITNHIASVATKGREECTPSAHFIIFMCSWTPVYGMMLPTCRWVSPQQVTQFKNSKSSQCLEVCLLSNSKPCQVGNQCQPPQTVSRPDWKPFFRILVVTIWNEYISPHISLGRISLVMCTLFRFPMASYSMFPNTYAFIYSYCLLIRELQSYSAIWNHDFIVNPQIHFKCSHVSFVQSNIFISIGNVKNTSIIKVPTPIQTFMPI